MNQFPPPLRDQTRIDAGHLNLLSIFHYVGAGLALLGIGFLFLHFLFVQIIVNNQKMMANAKSTPLPPNLFVILTVIYSVLGLWYVGSCVVNVLSAIYLRQRKNRTFSMVVAGINCLHMPLGTVLGVFTMIILMRESVRETYETSTQSGPPGQ